MSKSVLFEAPTTLTSRIADTRCLAFIDEKYSVLQLNGTQSRLLGITV